MENFKLKAQANSKEPKPEIEEDQVVRSPHLPSSSSHQVCVNIQIIDLGSELRSEQYYPYECLQYSYHDEREW